MPEVSSDFNIGDVSPVNSAAVRKALDTLNIDSLITRVNELEEKIKKLEEEGVGGDKVVIFNYSFEVDENGNLVIKYPDDAPEPRGFSIDANGYLVYKE